MPDIRQSTDFFDDFDRPPEEPLTGVPPGSWARTDAVWSQGLRIRNDVPGGNGAAVEPSAGSKFGSSYWTPIAWDGDDAEAWGWAVGGQYPGIHWQIGLESSPGGSSAVDGYALRRSVTTAGGSLRLIKVINGSYATNLGVIPAPAIPTSALWMLIRRNGTSVEGWMSSTPTVAWTLYLSAVDTTYTTGLHLTIALSDNARQASHGWDDVGGGPHIRRHMPQIYRIIHA